MNDNDREMEGPWSRVKRRILRLQELDRECGAFGAREHRYAFGAEVSPWLLAAHEERLGGALPAQLRTYYLAFGDGGAGPHYGVLSLVELASPPPNVLQRLWHAMGGDPPRTVYVIHTGCGRYLAAHLGERAADSVLGEEARGADWLGEFDLWLDTELPVFERAAELAASGARQGEIAARLRQEFPGYLSCERVAMSVLGNPEAREL